MRTESQQDATIKRFPYFWTWVGGRCNFEPSVVREISIFDAQNKNNDLQRWTSQDVLVGNCPLQTALAHDILSCCITYAFVSGQQANCWVS